jgi:hypothetical protein
MITLLNSLTPQQKGFGALGLGVLILVLHSFGIMRELLNLVIFAGAFGLIAYGLYTTGYWAKFMAIVNKRK